MQGPERCLVVESRSDKQPDGVEDAKQGRRGVGEIGGADELLETVENMNREVRRIRKAAMKEDDKWMVSYARQAEAALGKLQAYVEVTLSERSDLSNDKGLAVGALDSNS